MKHAALIILPALLAVTVAAQQGRRTLPPGPPVVYVAGQVVNFDRTPPIIVNQRAMVPMRGVFERFGATLEWNARTKMVTAFRGNRKIVMHIGKALSTVNGEAVLMDSPPLIRSGRTMVPLRFLAENLNSEVAYHPEERLIRITPN